ncbi:DUF1491 family protein [Bombella sp. ESL0385]|uniref:DUF1491 family protein n=1 Tax=Bombella sp. ESL0385 TaxID=2676446 RepID=UPI0012D86188|nr:DUF1491 family protein [Bombella sp. ESL0385]MUG89694.1 DUF1491 family protein [Bombella sp. ESL0385]
MVHGLKSGFWIRATLRRLNQNGLIAVIAHKGDEDAGSIFIILTARDGQTAILQEDDTSWHRHNFTATATESTLQQAMHYLERQKRFDPDLWIIEIDVPDITHPLEKELGTRRIH